MELSVVRELQEALDQLDARRAAACYSADALFVTPGRPPAEGREAVQRVFEEDFRAPGFKLTLTVTGTEIARSGDLAFARGIFQVSFSNPQTAAPVQIGGSYLQVLRRRGDEPWRIAMDISSPGPAD